MQGKNRVLSYLRSEGPNPKAIKEGLLWLDSICKSNNKKVGLVAFLGKDQSERVLSQAIGVDFAKTLRKTGQARIPGSVTEVKLFTEKDYTRQWDGPVLVVYPPKKLLDAVDSLFDVTHVLVIPWMIKEIDYWINTWNVSELGGVQPSPKNLVSNPVVEEALKDLTLRVNVSTGLSHPLDKASAVDLFRRLLAAGEQFDPDEVRAWLVAEGKWKPENADQVKEVAKGVLDGKRFRENQSRWNERIVDNWRQEAKKRDSSKET